MPATDARALEGPLAGPLPQAVGAARVRGEERRRPRGRPSNRWRCRASATARSVPGLIGRCRSAWRASGVDARIDDHEPGARLHRLLDERHQVDPARRGVGAPDDDQLRVEVVLVGDRRHLAVHRLRGGAGGRRADGAGEPRGAEAAEQPCVGGVLREQAVGAAVGERQDRLAAEALARLGAGAWRAGRSPRPSRLGRSAPLPLRAHANGRVQQPVRARPARSAKRRTFAQM